MKTVIVKICFVSCFILMAQMVYAQLYLKSGLVERDISEFIINEFYLANAGSSPPLFWIEMTNSFPEQRELKLRLTIYYCNFPDSESVLALGESKKFKLSPGAVRVDNKELFSKKSPYYLKSYRLSKQNLKKYNELIQNTGKLPAGSYKFDLTLETNDSTETCYDALITEIFDPTPPQLISPGRSTDPNTELETYPPLPMFQWNSRASEFKIRICEQTSPSISPQDVIKTDPRFETIFKNTFFQYPANEAPPLEEGKVYCWQLTAISQSLNGKIELTSDIWSFKVATFKIPFTDQLRVQLKKILGTNKYNKLFSDNGTLTKLSATGTMMNNGASISFEELDKLIKQFESGQLKMANYTVK
jgi:hypothetical protein